MADRRSKTRQYWLFKSEPNAFSMDDLKAMPNGVSPWDGVRNYQARNLLRDDVRVGDRILFYYSNVQPLGVAGTMTCVKAGYPDHTQFDTMSKYYDAKSDPDNPRWFLVDVKFQRKFSEIITRAQLQDDPETAEMLVLQRGSRLSIQPITEEQWLAVHRLAGVNPR